MNEFFEALKTVYQLEQAAGTWANLMLTKQEITMLITNLKSSKTELAKLKNASGSDDCGGGRGSDGGSSNSSGAGLGGRGGDDSAATCVLMLTKTSDIIKHPTEG